MKINISKLIRYFQEAKEIKKNTNLSGLVAYSLYKLKIRINVFKNNKTDNYKIFIIGSGTHTLSNILPNILILKKKVSLIYLHSNPNDKLIEKIYGVQTTKNLDFFINNIKSKDRVFILSNSATHYEYIERLNIKNCLIFVEKPLVNNRKNYENILINYKKINKENILIGFNRNYTKAFYQIRELISKNSNKIFEINYRINFGTRTNNNLNRFIENCCHYIFFILSLRNNKLISNHKINSKDYNTVHQILKFSDDSIASIQFTSEGTRYNGIKEHIHASINGINIEIVNFERVIINNKIHRIKQDSYGYKNIINNFLNNNFNSNFDQAIEMTRQIFFK